MLSIKNNVFKQLSCNWKENAKLDNIGKHTIESLFKYTVLISSAF